MWVIKTDTETLVLSNNAEDDIHAFVKRDYPKASVYVCEQPNAFATYAAHVNAQEVVYHTESQPTLDDKGEPQKDEDGNPVMEDVQVGAWQSVGNTASVDDKGRALVLLDAKGNETQRLPLVVK